MADNQVKVKILPLHNIGGVGNAGAIVVMSEADAEMYWRDGYVEYVNEVAAAMGPSTASGKAPLSAQDEVVQSDHAIMKPHSKRGRK